MDFLPGGPEISLEILFRDVVLRFFIDVLPTELAMDLLQVLLIGARQARGPRDYVSKFDLTAHKPPLTHCLGSLAGIIRFFKQFASVELWNTPPRWPDHGGHMWLVMPMKDFMASGLKSFPTAHFTAWDGHASVHISTVS